MNRREIELYLKDLKDKKGIRVYTPFKYFEGLKTKKEIQSRFRDIVRGKSSDDSKQSSYQTFATDKQRVTKPSYYTKTFQQLYGRTSKSLEQKANVTGVPLSILKKVYNKGKAAWRTGHRVGANEEQWGYARVHSFLTLGCTVFSADFMLFEMALKEMKPKDRKRWLSLRVTCPKKTLESSYYKKRQTYEKFLALRRKYIKR